MPRIPIPSNIDYLIARRYAFLLRPVSLSSVPSESVSDSLLQEARAFRAKLECLSKDQIEALVNEERAREASEFAAKAKAEEEARWFNQPTARSDYVFWSANAFWTLDEAVALSLGRDPNRVNWAAIKSLESSSAFVTEYGRRKQLADRAALSKLLSDPVAPGVFLAWAKRLGVSCPPELESAVEARGIQIADWRSLYDAKCRELDVAQNRIRELEAAEQRQDLQPTPGTDPDRTGDANDTRRPVPKSVLSEWWGRHAAALDSHSEEEISQFVRATFPDNLISRSQIREMRGPQKPGPRRSRRNPPAR